MYSPHRRVRAPGAPAPAPAGGNPSYAWQHGLYWLASNLSTESPLLPVVDDLQWCDAPSARALAFIARRLEGQPLGLILATRPLDPALTPDAATLGADPGGCGLGTRRHGFVRFSTKIVPAMASWARVVPHVTVGEQSGTRLSNSPAVCAELRPGPGPAQHPKADSLRPIRDVEHARHAQHPESAPAHAILDAGHAWRRRARGAALSEERQQRRGQGMGGREGVYGS